MKSDAGARLFRRSGTERLKEGTCYSLVLLIKDGVVNKVILDRGYQEKSVSSC